MPHTIPQNVATLAQAVYERDILPTITTNDRGKYLVINVGTGEYEMDADDLAASKRAKARFPGATLFAMRVGYATAYRLGGRFVVDRP